MIKRHLKIQDSTIIYFIERKNVKNINIRLDSEGYIHISANKKVPLEHIENLVKENIKALTRSIERFKKRQSVIQEYKTKQFVTGDTIKLLGITYTINVIETSFSKVCFDGNTLMLCLPNPDSYDQRIKVLKAYIRSQCEHVFSRILKYVFPRFQEYNIDYPRFTVREMKTRWGSCAVNKAKISLNMYLLQVPLKSIEQVIVHELCHFIQPNHSKKFYALMDKTMPDWRDHKTILEREGSVHGW